MAQTRTPLLFLLIVTLLFSCSEDEPVFTFADKGVVRGRAFLSGGYFDSVGIDISLYGGRYSAQAKSGDEGYFRFEDVPTGTLELLATYPGYGEMRIFNIRQTGMDTIMVQADFNSDIVLYPIPVHAAPSFSNGTASLFEGSVYAQFELSGESGYYRVFFDVTENVSSETYLFTELKHSYGSGWVEGFWLNGFRDLFPNAKTIYMRAYADGGGSYFDYNTGKLVFSALNKASVSQVYVIELP